MTDEKIDPKKPFALILMNLGGPDSLAAIRPFLVNLFSDRQIIKLPVQPVLARLIARRRSKKVAARYEMIGGGSPIVRLTREQAEETAATLAEAGYDCRAYVGMNYWHPFIRDAVADAVAAGYRQIIGMSLFPHYSRATAGACARDFRKAVESTGEPLSVRIIDPWYDHPLYLKALAETVEAGLGAFSEEERRDLKVIFSAHSLPKEFVDDGDPYTEHLKVTIKGIVEETGPLDWLLTYQSRSGPVEWLEPQTDEEIARLGKAGVKNMLIVPVSFVSDHIETLYELDIMYAELAKAWGVEKYERAPALNSSPTFIRALADIVEKSFEQTGPGAG